jgi:hypothetical protein
VRCFVGLAIWGKIVQRELHWSRIYNWFMWTQIKFVWQLLVENPNGRCYQSTLNSSEVQHGAQIARWTDKHDSPVMLVEICYMDILWNVEVILCTHFCLLFQNEFGRSKRSWKSLFKLLTMKNSEMKWFTGFCNVPLLIEV